MVTSFARRFAGHASGSCFVLGRQSLDFFPGQRSEYLDVTGCIGIALRSARTGRTYKEMYSGDRAIYCRIPSYRIYRRPPL